MEACNYVFSNVNRLESLQQPGMQNMAAQCMDRPALGMSEDNT